MLSLFTIKRAKHMHRIGLIKNFASFKMPFYSASKRIPSEISMSGDCLRLEGNKGWKICPRVGNLSKKFVGVRDFTDF